jgi:cytochrome c-type biogenesis protein CcmH
MVWLVFVGLGFLLISIAAYSLVKTSKDAPPERIEPPQRNNRRAIPFAMGTIAAILLVGAAVTYGALDSPRLPGEPDRSAIVAATSAEELAKQLQDAPTSAGYKQLANMYFMAGQYDKAVAADHRAIELGANDSGTWSQFGESIVMAGDGAVAPQALAAFTNAISRDPQDARARYYIGMAQAQIGNLRQAVAIWRDLEDGADPNAPWLPMVRQHVVAFSKQGGFDPESVPPAAPSATALRSAVAAMTVALNRNGITGAGAAPTVDMSTSGPNTQDNATREVRSSR